MPHPLNPRLNLPKGIRDVVALVPGQTTMGGNAMVAPKQARHVDPATGTTADIINALIAAGLMAP